MLSDKKFKELAANLKRLERFGDQDTKMAVTQARIAVEEADTPEDQVDEELVAYVIEHHVNNQQAPKGIKGWLQKIFRALKASLFRFGLVRNITLDDMVAMAEGAAAKVRGETETTVEGEPAYALTGNTPVRSRGLKDAGRPISRLLDEMGRQSTENNPQHPPHQLRAAGEQEP